MFIASEDTTLRRDCFAWRLSSSPRSDSAIRLNDSAFVPWAGQVLTAAECDRVLEMVRDADCAPGETVNLPAGYRRCNCTWLPPNGECRWLYESVERAFQESNKYFEFDIEGIAEPIMYAVYGPTDGFDWHMDCGPQVASARKISLSIQLTAPEDYTGGDLELFGLPSSTSWRQRGVGIAFPAFMLHRVKSIEEGSRRALVTWAYGKTFR